MPTVTQTQMIVNGFGYSTSGMIAESVNLFTDFAIPILAIGGGMALFAGVFQLAMGAVRSLRG